MLFSILSYLVLVLVIFYCSFFICKLISAKVFKGVVDLINMECYNWENSSEGLNYERKKLSQKDGKIWESAFKGRIRLIETLVDLDELLAETVLTQKESIEGMKPGSIQTSVRKVTEGLRGEGI